jgi:hypothetical protein
MADSVAICSVMDSPEFADTGAKAFAAQWYGYALCLFFV